MILSSALGMIAYTQSPFALENYLSFVVRQTPLSYPPECHVVESALFCRP
jgi:hypothetical protein